MSLYNKTIRLTIGNFRTWPVAKALCEATRLETQTDQGIGPRVLLREHQTTISAKRSAEATAKFEAEHRA